MYALMRFVFYLLYHPFAFTYDLVAATVSLGRWKDWVLSVVPFIKGTRVLEIGHGPGHLQRDLLSRGLFAVGIDESAPMGRLAQRNLKRFLRQTPVSTSSTPPSAYAQIQLARCLAQELPFPNGMFDSVVATFPSQYIFDSVTLTEANRVLTPHGRFVILPSATLLGRGLLDRFMAFLFQFTGQIAPDIATMLRERTKEPLSQAGFHVQIHELSIKSSLVFIIVATKAELKPPSTAAGTPTRA